MHRKMMKGVMIYGYVFMGIIACILIPHTLYRIARLYIRFKSTKSCNFHMLELIQCGFQLFYSDFACVRIL